MHPQAPRGRCTPHAAPVPPVARVLPAAGGRPRRRPPRPRGVPPYVRPTRPAAPPRQRLCQPAGVRPAARPGPERAARFAAGRTARPRRRRRGGQPGRVDQRRTDRTQPLPAPAGLRRGGAEGTGRVHHPPRRVAAAAGARGRRRVPTHRRRAPPDGRQAGRPGDRALPGDGAGGQGRLRGGDRGEHQAEGPPPARKGPRLPRLPRPLRRDRGGPGEEPFGQPAGGVEPAPAARPGAGGRGRAAGGEDLRRPRPGPAGPERGGPGRRDGPGDRRRDDGPGRGETLPRPGLRAGRRRRRRGRRGRRPHRPRLRRRHRPRRGRIGRRDGGGR